MTDNKAKKAFLGLMVMFLFQTFVLGLYVYRYYAADYTMSQEQVQEWCSNDLSQYPQDLDTFHDYTISGMYNGYTNSMLNAYRYIYQHNESLAYDLNPGLYANWSGYKTPAEHTQWLEEHAK